MCPGTASQAPASRARTGRSAPRRTAPRVSAGVRRALLFTAVVGVGLLVLTLCSMAGTATVPGGVFQEDNSSDDEQGPTIGAASKVDDETLQLTIIDNEDVDESSIGPNDVQLSAGRIDNVTATESGSNATAEIHLVSPVNRDEVRLSISPSASITDEAGNSLQEYRTVTRTVDGMDGVAPFVSRYRVAPGPNGTVEVGLGVTEDLSELGVEVTGPWTTRLTRADFSAGEGFHDYVATVEPPRDGEYRFRLVELVDESGNRDNPRMGTNVTVDTTPPVAVAVVDVGASSGRNYTFDANQSMDASEIRSVSWDFGDGTNATGTRVSHRFEPGNYTVTARVTDARGLTGTDQLFVVAREDNASVDPATLPDASATVRVTGGGDGGASAMVRVAGADAGERVAVPTGGGRPVATGSTLTLERLAVTPARNASYRLGVQVTDAATLGDAASATDGAPLGGFTVVHDVTDTALSNVSVHLGVDRAALAATGEDAESVSLYRHHDGDWTALETVLVGQDNGTVRYRATSPGFSRFALVAGGTGAAAAPATAGETGNPPTTVSGSAATATPGDEGGPLVDVGALLGLVPLGLLDALVRYVGSVLVAGFLLLKSVALALGY